MSSQMELQCMNTKNPISLSAGEQKLEFPSLDKTRSDSDELQHDDVTICTHKLKLLEMPESEIKLYHSKALRQFYKKQNFLIRSVVDGPASSDEDDAHDNALSARIAVNISFSVNISLLILKICAAIFSGSMAMLASALDSFLDLISGLVLYFTQHTMSRKDPYTYPQGKNRMEPVGVIIFASIMGMSSLQIVVQAMQVLVSGFSDGKPTLTIDLFTKLVLVYTISVKACLFVYCRITARLTGSSAVAAYAQDHRNDVITNSVGVCAIFIAYYFRVLWFFDSFGAIFIASWIIVSWVQTGIEQAYFLAGKTADPDFIKRVTFIGINHHSAIKKIDTVRAYHFGANFLVEMHIVLPEDMPLQEAHDIGEELEIKIEELPEVERAFVHLDYNWTHPIEHKKGFGLV